MGVMGVVFVSLCVDSFNLTLRQGASVFLFAVRFPARTKIGSL